THEPALQNEQMAMKLLEESSGMGALVREGVTLCAVRYSVKRYQGVVENSGLPIPGLHRIEGAVEAESSTGFANWVGAALRLRLSDGRALGVTLADASGRILSEGHGPQRCMCC